MPPPTATPPSHLTATPPPKPPPTTFSPLPREIRDQIYAHLFIDLAVRGPNTLSTLCGISSSSVENDDDDDDAAMKGIFAVVGTWVEKSRVAFEMCVALYRHWTFRHGDLGADLGPFLRRTVGEVLLPRAKDGVGCCGHAGAQQQQQLQRRQQQRFTNEAFLANMTVSICLSSGLDKGASYALYQLLRCPRLRSLGVDLKMSASCAGTYDGDGREWASPLSEIAQACERLQKAAGGRLRLVVCVDEAFRGEHVLDEFERRGVSWRRGGDRRRRGWESLGDEWLELAGLTKDVRLRQDRDHKQHLKITGWKRSD